MKLMIPFIPHLANECLELLKSDNVNKWPKIEVGALLDVKIAVQVNGKTTYNFCKKGFDRKGYRQNNKGKIKGEETH